MVMIYYMPMNKKTETLFLPHKVTWPGYETSQDKTQKQIILSPLLSIAFPASTHFFYISTEQVSCTANMNQPI